MCSELSLAQFSEKETQFLYWGEAKRNNCVYTFGQGTKVELKREYFLSTCSSLFWSYWFAFFFSFLCVFISSMSEIKPVIS